MGSARDICERGGQVCRTLNSLYRERRTMKNIALLSLLTLAILQPLAEAQKEETRRCADFVVVSGSKFVKDYKFYGILRSFL